MDDLLDIEPEELLLQMEEIDLEPDMEALDKFVEDNTEYWTIKEAAEWLEVTTRTVRTYMKKGLLKPHHRGEKDQVFFSHFDVIELGWKSNETVMKYTEMEKYKYIAKQLLSTTSGRNALYEVLQSNL
jgi:hypothetical protein